MRTALDTSLAAGAATTPQGHRHPGEPGPVRRYAAPIRRTAVTAVGLLALIVLASVVVPLAAPVLLCVALMAVRRFPGERHLERWRLARSASSRRRRIVARLAPAPAAPRVRLRGSLLRGCGRGRRGPPLATV